MAFNDPVSVIAGQPINFQPKIEQPVAQQVPASFVSTSNLDAAGYNQYSQPGARYWETPTVAFANNPQGLSVYQQQTQQAQQLNLQSQNAINYANQMPSSTGGHGLSPSQTMAAYNTRYGGEAPMPISMQSKITGAYSPGTTSQGFVQSPDGSWYDRSGQAFVPNNLNFIHPGEMIAGQEVRKPFISSNLAVQPQISYPSQPGFAGLDGRYPREGTYDPIANGVIDFGASRTTGTIWGSTLGALQFITNRGQIQASGSAGIINPVTPSMSIAPKPQVTTIYPETRSSSMYQTRDTNGNVTTAVNPGTANSGMTVMQPTGGRAFVPMKYEAPTTPDILGSAWNLLQTPGRMATQGANAIGSGIMGVNQAVVNTLPGFASAGTTETQTGPQMIAANLSSGFNSAGQQVITLGQTFKNTITKTITPDEQPISAGVGNTQFIAGRPDWAKSTPVDPALVGNQEFAYNVKDKDFVQVGGVGGVINTMGDNINTLNKLGSGVIFGGASAVTGKPAEGLQNVFTPFTKTMATFGPTSPIVQPLNIVTSAAQNIAGGVESTFGMKNVQPSVPITPYSGVASDVATGMIIQPAVEPATFGITYGAGALAGEVLAPITTRINAINVARTTSGGVTTLGEGVAAFGAAKAAGGTIVDASKAIKFGYYAPQVLGVAMGGMYLYGTATEAAKAPNSGIFIGKSATNTLGFMEGFGKGYNDDFSNALGSGVDKVKGINFGGVGQRIFYGKGWEPYSPSTGVGPADMGGFSSGATKTGGNVATGSQSLAQEPGIPSWRWTSGFNDVTMPVVNQYPSTNPPTITIQPGTSFGFPLYEQGMTSGFVAPKITTQTQDIAFKAPSGFDFGKNIPPQKEYTYGSRWYAGGQPGSAPEIDPMSQMQKIYNSYEMGTGGAGGYKIPSPRQMFPIYESTPVNPMEPWGEKKIGDKMVGVGFSEEPNTILAQIIERNTIGVGKTVYAKAPITVEMPTEGNLAILNKPPQMGIGASPGTKGGYVDISSKIVGPVSMGRGNFDMTVEGMPNFISGEGTAGMNAPIILKAPKVPISQQVNTIDTRTISTDWIVPQKTAGLREVNINDMGESFIINTKGMETIVPKDMIQALQSPKDGVMSPKTGTHDTIVDVTGRVAPVGKGTRMWAPENGGQLQTFYPTSSSLGSGAVSPETLQFGIKNPIVEEGNGPNMAFLEEFGVGPFGENTPSVKSPSQIRASLINQGLASPIKGNLNRPDVLTESEYLMMTSMKDAQVGEWLNRGLFKPYNEQIALGKVWVFDNTESMTSTATQKAMLRPESERPQKVQMVQMQDQGLDFGPGVDINEYYPGGYRKRNLPVETAKFGFDYGGDFGKDNRKIVETLTGNGRYNLPENFTGPQSVSKSGVFNEYAIDRASITTPVTDITNITREFQITQPEQTNIIITKSDQLLYNPPDITRINIGDQLYQNIQQQTPFTTRISIVNFGLNVPETGYVPPTWPSNKSAYPKEFGMIPNLGGGGGNGGGNVGSHNFGEYSPLGSYSSNIFGIIPKGFI